jgi:hypothetical protein
MDSFSFFTGFSVGGILVVIAGAVATYFNSVVRKQNAETESIKWNLQKEKRKESSQHSPSEE